MEPRGAEGVSRRGERKPQEGGGTQGVRGSSRLRSAEGGDGESEERSRRTAGLKGPKKKKGKIRDSGR